MSKPEKKSFEVDKLKLRLDKFLASKLPEFSRAVIQRQIQAGLVTVNGKAVIAPSAVVKKDYKVVFQLPEKDVLEAKPMTIKTLYKGDGFLVIDKPYGLTVHPGAGIKADSLVSGLLFQFKDIATVGETERPGIVHRLDKDTSGAMLVATTPAMYEYLKSVFANREIKKTYLALVHGIPSKPHGFIDTSIGKSKTDFRKYTTKNTLQSKDSLTEYKVLKTYSLPKVGAKQGKRGSVFLDEYALLEVQLHTGRTHQIRVHLASVGHPVVADPLYGNTTANNLGLKRQFLHASKLELKLPSGEWIEVESPITSDLKEVLKKLT